MAETRTIHYAGAAIPRFSEKASKLATMHQFVFRLDGNWNKVELKKYLEQNYGVKIDRVNMIVTADRIRNFGRTPGRIAGFKKAIVTLADGSKEFDFGVQAA